MKIYVSHASNYEHVSKLYEQIKQSSLAREHSFFLPHDNNLINTRDIISAQDLVVAEVSLPSTGQGIEIGWASYAQVPIYFIHQKDAAISSSLKLVSQNIVEYENGDEILQVISGILDDFTKPQSAL